MLAGILLFGCARHHEISKNQYDSAYHKPLNSPGEKFAGLPPAVQNTIRAETGSAVIEDILKDTSSGLVVYRVDFVNSNLWPPLFIARAGSVLNPDLTVAVGAGDDAIGVSKGSAISLKPSDLPPNVMK